MTAFVIITALLAATAGLVAFACHVAGHTLTPTPGRRPHCGLDTSKETP